MWKHAADPHRWAIGNSQNYDSETIIKIHYISKYAL